MRGVPNPFVQLGAAAGWSFVPIGLLARLPFAMLTLGISSYVALVRDSYSQGGVAAGCYAAGAALGTAVAGACADRFGQRRLVLALAAVNTLLVGATLVTAHGQSLALLLTAATLCGFTIPPVGPLSRVRWSALIVRKVTEDRSRVQGAAFSYETLADELTFVFGPVLIGVLAVLAPAAPLVVCAALTLVFGTLFAVHPSARVAAAAARTPHTEVASVREFLRANQVLLVLGMVTIGSLLGALSTSVVAFAGEQGSTQGAGFIYAGFGIGSGAASLGMVAVSQRIGLHARWIAGAVWAVALAAMLPLVESGAVLACLLCLLGVGIGPVIVSIYRIAADSTPTGRSTVQMTILSGSLIGGNAVGAPMAGMVADRSGSSTAFAVVVAGCVTLACIGFASAWTAGRRGRQA
ncbi:MFS transporter [Rhodococcus sp. (in: high G+C Gram-positive bacteria)]|uniref:MFS transporter n=1 Tax=Rhodococcus sp. TaxID=1831 RepID=UPI003B8A7B9D